MEQIGDCMSAAAQYCDPRTVELNKICLKVFTLSCKASSSSGLGRQRATLYLLQIWKLMLEITAEGSACSVAPGKAAK